MELIRYIASIKDVGTTRIRFGGTEMTLWN